MRMQSSSRAPVLSATRSLVSTWITSPPRRSRRRASAWYWTAAASPRDGGCRRARPPSCPSCRTRRCRGAPCAGPALRLWSRSRSWRLHFLGRGALVGERQQPGNVSLGTVQRGRVLERPGGVLEPQVEQLLARLTEAALELVVGQLSDLTGPQRDHPPASRTWPGPGASWRPAGSPRGLAARARRPART